MLPTTFTITVLQAKAKALSAILNKPVTLTKSGTKWLIKITSLDYIEVPAIALTTREMTIHIEGLLIGQRLATDVAYNDGYNAGLLDAQTPNR